MWESAKVGTLAEVVSRVRDRQIPSRVPSDSDILCKLILTGTVLEIVRKTQIMSNKTASLTRRKNPKSKYKLDKSDESRPSPFSKVT